MKNKNLFIFNFDYEKIHPYTFLYLLPILVFFIVLEIILRQIPNVYSHKKNYLEANADKIETLILGSSHTYYGIDPVYFSSNNSVFNGAHVSQSLDYDYEILKRYAAKLNNLKTVVIPVSYFTPWSRLSNGSESWRVKNYVIHYKISKNDDKLKYHFAVLGSKFTVHIRHLASYLHGNNITCSKQGRGIYDSKDASDLEETGKTAAARHTRNDIHSLQETRIFNDNISILDSIINLCGRHDANVLLLTPPAHETYRRHLNKEQLTVMVETANKIANKYQNCTYLNLMTDSSFVFTDYHDADHLSEIGAKKLSVFIDAYIKNF